jgi:hypothetical protein
MKTKEIFSWLKFIKQVNIGLLLFLLLLCYLFVNLIFSFGYYYLCEFNETTTFLDCLYFSNVTSFSLGYGDFVPVTVLGKVFVILHMIITSLLFALLISVLTVKIFHTGDTIIFSKKIFYDKSNLKIGFRLLNIHSVPLINPEIRVHYTEHCVGNVMAKVSILHVREELIGFFGRHDFICNVEVNNDFLTNLEHAILFDNDMSHNVKSRFRFVVAISGKNGIQEIVQIKRYYAKDFKEGKSFKQIQYNEEDRKSRIDYSKFGNFKEDFENIIEK